MNIVNKFYNIKICVPFMPLGDTSCNFAPTSFIKPTATSTESSVGFSNRRVSNSNAKISWAYNTSRIVRYQKNNIIISDLQEQQDVIRISAFKYVMYTYHLLIDKMGYKLD